jgi:hypothetical protein
MARYNSKGWHFQTDRHSRAKLTGHAGGNYASERIKKILRKHPEYKNLTFKQLNKKGVFLKYQSDSDKDGVANIKDCRPLNKKAQDNGEYNITNKRFRNKKTGKIETQIPILEMNDYEEIPEQETTIETTEPMTEQKKSNILALDRDKRWRRNASNAIKKAEEKLENTYESFKEKREETKAKKLDRDLERIREITHQDVDELEDLDLKMLNEAELRKLAEIEPESFFSESNRYEDELKRRIDARERIIVDLTEEKMEAQKKGKERLKEYEEKQNGKSFFS